MKRGMPWSDEDDSSSEEEKTGQPSKKTASQGLWLCFVTIKSLVCVLNLNLNLNLF